MNFAIKPPSLRKNVVQFTIEEIAQNGCCYPMFSDTQSSKIKKTSSFQHHSEPKLKREKKIDLLVAKNRLSQAKFQTYSQSLSENRCQKNQNQLKNIQSSTNFASLISKTTTQKNSLKNSRTKLCLNRKSMKLQDPNKNQKGLSLSNKYNRVIQKAIPQQHTKAQIANIQNLSQISMIQQQFVSHGSTTLNALNILNHYPFSESKGHELVLTPVRYMIDAANNKKNNEIKETPNPLQRLIQNKKGANRESHRLRLYL